MPADNKQEEINAPRMVNLVSCGLAYSTSPEMEQRETGSHVFKEKNEIIITGCTDKIGCCFHPSEGVCQMSLRKFFALLGSLASLSLPLPLISQGQSTPKPKPRVVVLSVNGMELDVVRPLVLQGKMPNLSSVIKQGAYGKLRTVSAPNCPRVFSTMFTSTKPEEDGVTGFVVG